MQTKTGYKPTNRHRGFAAAALAVVVTMTGVAAQPSASSHERDGSQTSKTRKWIQIGKASWYGRRFQGHRTASGEAFDKDLLTCAHRTLPIGSLIKVTNLINHRSVMVRVNDRGPVEKSRVIDLSYAAAKRLGFVGTARVSLEKVDGVEAARLNWPELGPPQDEPIAR